LLPYRELDDAFNLSDSGGDTLADTPTGKNIRHLLHEKRPIGRKSEECRLKGNEVGRPPDAPAGIMRDSEKFGRRRSAAGRNLSHVGYAFKLTAGGCNVEKPVYPDRRNKHSLRPEHRSRRRPELS